MPPYCNPETFHLPSRPASCHSTISAICLVAISAPEGSKGALLLQSEDTHQSGRMTNPLTAIAGGPWSKMAGGFIEA
jgi:hypothetical protein